MRFKIKKIIAIILNIIGVLDLLLIIERKKYNSQYIRIINYHNTHFDKIDRQIKWLKKHYKDVSFCEFEAFMGGQPLSGKKPGIMLTFDDGLEGNYQTAVEVLKNRSMTGYFMVSSDLIGNEGYMTVEQIRNIIKQGHVIGCHTASHHRMNEEDNIETLMYEIKESKIKLEELFDISIDIFCWCGGEEDTYTIEAEKVIEQAGYKYGFMTNSYPVIKGTDRFHIQRINVEDDWSISLLKFQISGLMDFRFSSKRKRVNDVTSSDLA